MFSFSGLILTCPYVYPILLCGNSSPGLIISVNCLISDNSLFLVNITFPALWISSSSVTYGRLLLNSGSNNYSISTFIPVCSFSVITYIWVALARPTYVSTVMCLVRGLMWPGREQINDVVSVVSIMNRNLPFICSFVCWTSLSLQVLLDSLPRFVLAILFSIPFWILSVQFLFWCLSNYPLRPLQWPRLRPLLPFIEL